MSDTFTEEQIRHLLDALESHIWMMNDRGEGYGRGAGSIKACEELYKLLMKEEEK